MNVLRGQREMTFMTSGEVMAVLISATFCLLNDSVTMRNAQFQEEEKLTSLDRGEARF